MRLTKPKPLYIPSSYVFYQKSFDFRLLTNCSDMMSFYLVRPCKSTAAYEAIPKNDLKLDLRKLEPELTRLGYNIEINAKVILVVTKDHNEISIYPKGKLMIKVDDQAVAEQIAEELEPILF